MENTAKSKVVRLNQSPISTELLEDIIEGLKNGDITDFIIMARKKVPIEDQEEVGGTHIYRKYWFSGDSTLPVIGMLEYMKCEIWADLSSEHEED